MTQIKFLKIITNSCQGSKGKVKEIIKITNKFVVSNELL